MENNDLMENIMDMAMRQYISSVFTEYTSVNTSTDNLHKGIVLHSLFIRCTFPTFKPYWTYVSLVLGVSILPFVYIVTTIDSLIFIKESMVTNLNFELI